MKHTIAEVARDTGFTPQYVRSLIRKGQLHSTLEPIAEGAQVSRHMIDDDDVKRFLNSTKRKTKRTDGRNKYVFYATPEEQLAVVEALLAAGLNDIVESIRTANKIKPPYRPQEEE